MKIVVCDITGRTLNYDLALFHALKNMNDSDWIQLWIPKNRQNESGIKGFNSFIPQRYRHSSNLLVKIIKAIDTLFAYLVICFRMIKLKPGVFHLQWFPFISLGTKGKMIDVLFLRLIKSLSPNTRFVFTIHNICPHDMKEGERKNYNPVFAKALSFFDHFIVHTQSTKDQVCRELNIRKDSVSVVLHGVFIPEGFDFDSISLHNNKETRIIMYGNQNWYKGTDLLVKSLDYLSVEVRKSIKITICGAISTSYLVECKSYDKDNCIEWIPKFLDDNTLFECINESDIIVLPYRRISQSGVLLLALATKRYIITSDLDSFKETLTGFPEDLFFKADDPEDLARVITRYVERNVNEDLLKASISQNMARYSWDSSAQITLQLYKGAMSC